MMWFLQTLYTFFKIGPIDELYKRLYCQAVDECREWFAEQELESSSSKPWVEDLSACSSEGCKELAEQETIAIVVECRRNWRDE